MTTSRRDFLKSTSFIALGFAGLRTHLQPAQAIAETSTSTTLALQSDPKGLLDLPAGFSYQVISQGGQAMSDGLLVPGLADGMGTFAGPNGLTILIRNHELTPDCGHSPFGDKMQYLGQVSADKLYDAGKLKTPGTGGTTTIVYDTKKRQVVREFLSLTGTIRNCAGGITPWNSWITCEETVLRPHTLDTYSLERDHGYNFEVPASATPAVADPIPLTAMGRFNHEAVSVDPASGIVYQTEDRLDGLLYRFIPDQRQHLAAGGRLQALAIRDQPSAETRNWFDSHTFVPGKQHAVEWIDIDQVDAPNDDLRLRGFQSGAARFARGEGMWYGDGQVFFACTNGGAKMSGQIWRYRPSVHEGQEAEKREPGTLELFIEPNDSDLLMSADNLTVAPWGDLMVCEDRSEDVVRIVRVTPDGQLTTFAHSHARCEFAGAVFSPDGSTLFVNIQGQHKTLAITGDWSQLG